jgi:PAS domain S-box-containing protein
MHTHQQSAWSKYVVSVMAPRKATQQISEMLARTGEAAMLVDETGRVVIWNKAAEHLLGFRAHEVVGRACHDVLRGETLGGHPLCSLACPIGRQLARGLSVRNFDMQTRKRAGRLIWLNITSLPVPTRKKGGFQALHLFRDITKQMRLRRLAGELHRALLPPWGSSSDHSSSAPDQSPVDDNPPQISPALPLSEREKEILRLLASGKSTKKIADALSISPATVSNHVQHILDKLGAHSRLEALALAFHSSAPSSAAR